jgi:RNA polymerase sigma-70 factor (ECF subfamily)
MSAAARTVEVVARESYGRLVAFLAARTRDVAGAEDALGDALLAALATWPRDGVPENPAGWLLHAARRRLADAARHARVRDEHAEVLRVLASDAAAERAEASFPDQRLALFFVCAHPAIDATLHAPLMLQAVLGLDAARIAQAYLVAPATMGQRLVRAKTKIREAGIPFEVPEGAELARRLDSVLEAIYAAFGLGWDETAGADPARRELAAEALWLARALLQRLPGEPEVRALLALMLHVEARRGARRGPDGRYVPLSEQDPAAWPRPLLDEAERELAGAAALGRPGRFQLEAAIQSVHAERARGRPVDWTAIAAFYAELARLAPTLGAAIGRAAAVAEAHGPEPALALLDALEPAAVAAHQPYWAVRAHVLWRQGREHPASAAIEPPRARAQDPSVRAWLEARPHPAGPSTAGAP